MGENMNKSIPVLFQKLNTYNSVDTRFVKVKIWLMHLEENYNGSYFEKAVVEQSINSLKNTPILAYIEDNSYGEKDFSDHRMVLVKEDGEFKAKYLGMAIGLIPETNNAKFETRLCDDGIERMFLTVEGLIWTKWDDPIDIFKKDSIKSQSMELHSDYTGEFKEDGLFHFSSFKFFGACVLGDDVLPAMSNSTIEAYFSNSDFHKHIQEKMEQFKHLFSKEGGKEMSEEIKEEVIEENFESTEEEAQVEEQFVETVEETIESTEETIETQEETIEEEVIDEIDYKSEFERVNVELETLKQSFSTLEEEVVGLREFKEFKLTAERVEKENELFESFSAELSEDEMKEVKDIASEFTLEQIEEKLFTLVGKKKANFSKQPKKEKTSIKIEFDHKKDVEDNPYGGILNKYIKK